MVYCTAECELEFAAVWRPVRLGLNQVLYAFASLSHDEWTVFTDGSET